MTVSPSRHYGRYRKVAEANGDPGHLEKGIWRKIWTTGFRYRAAGRQRWQHKREL